MFIAFIGTQALYYRERVSCPRRHACVFVELGKWSMTLKMASGHQPQCNRSFVGATKPFASWRMTQRCVSRRKSSFREENIGRNRRFSIGLMTCKFKAKALIHHFTAISVARRSECNLKETTQMLQHEIPTEFELKRLRRILRCPRITADDIIQISRETGATIAQMIAIADEYARLRSPKAYQSASM